MTMRRAPDRDQCNRQAPRGHMSLWVLVWFFRLRFQEVDVEAEPGSGKSRQRKSAPVPGLLSMVGAMHRKLGVALVFLGLLSSCALPEAKRIRTSTQVAELVSVKDDYLCLQTFDDVPTVILERRRRGLGDCTEYRLFVEEYRTRHAIGGPGAPGMGVVMVPLLILALHDIEKDFQTVSSPSCPWSLAAAREGRTGCRKGSGRTMP